MDNKQFTDELFKRMYDLGYRNAEIDNGILYFFVNENEYLNRLSPRVPAECTCFEERNQLIDISEYLGIVDWNKVKVDTPIWTADNADDAISWIHAKLAGDAQ